MLSAVSAQPGKAGRRPASRSTDHAVAGAAPVRVLVSIPSIPTGVGMTCRSIVSSAAAAGYRTDLFTPRFQPDSLTSPVVNTVLPRATRVLPYVFMRRAASNRLHDIYLRTIGDAEIAYLWPSVPLSVHEVLHRRGNTIVAEAVNTRMALSKPLLDAAYDAAGLPPRHGITDERVAEQAARYELCSAIFTPSPATEAALKGSPLEDRFVSSSYGTWVPKDLRARRPKSPDETVTFLFVGTICVRKGIPDLLSAWKGMPKNARLRLVGVMEDGFAQRYQDDLSATNVSVAPYTSQVNREYFAADVFVHPSLEEGDSIVSYEAAGHGLPVIASRIGAGRIGAETDAIDCLDTGRREVLHARLVDYCRSPDIRAEWSSRARTAVMAYDWSRVGPRNYAALHRFLASRA